MLLASRRGRTGLAAALVVASLSLATAPSASPAEPGSPPRAFTYLRSTDGGAAFTPFQLGDTPESGITHVEASGGTVHALYDDQDPQPRRIFYRRSVDRGSSWADSVRLDTPQAGSVEHGDSGESDLDAEGSAVHVVWEDDAFLTADFELPVDVRLQNDVVLSDGTALSSETPPGPDNGDDSDNTILPAGTVFPAGSVDPRVDARFYSDGGGLTLGTDVEENIENRDDIFYTRSGNDGESFPVPRNITRSPDVHNVDPDVAAEGSLVVMAYESEDMVGDSTDAADVLVAVSRDGGESFGGQRNVNLTRAAGDQDEPAVGIAGSTVHVVFREAVPDPIVPDEEIDLPVGYVRSDDAGRTFSDPVSLPVGTPAADFATTTTPGIFVRGDEVHVLACHEDDPDSDSDGNDLLYWRSADGGRTFESAAVIARSDEPCNRPVLDGAGDNLWVAYERDVHSTSDVFLLRSGDGGRNWASPRNLSDDHESSADPSVSVDPGHPEDVHVSWTDSSDFLFAMNYGQELPVEDGDESLFANEDVIRFTGGGYKMVIDGSDVGLGNLRIDALATLPPSDPAGPPQFVLSFTEAADVPGVGTVDDSDLVLFVPSHLGDQTAGTFSLYLDGSTIGLDRPSEDIDAVDVDGDTLYLSTSGDFAVPDGPSGLDEDIFACHGFTAGATSACTGVTLAFAGSSAGLGSESEDVDAFSFSGEGNIPEGAAFFSTPGGFKVPTAAGGKSDIFSCTFPEEVTADSPLAECGGSSSPILTVFAAGSHGLVEDITALEFEY
jgi:hypothetical protein